MIFAFVLQFNQSNGRVYRKAQVIRESILSMELKEKKIID